MTYFLLSVTNTCNKACDYCAVKPWLNNPQYPDKATAQDFIRFLERTMQPGDVAEITGGEPTLFPGLREILDFLRKANAKAILRTNGAMLGEWRKDYANMIAVLARHGSDDGYMSERKKCLLPHDLVLDGIPEHIKQKERDKPIFVNDETSPQASHPFKSAFFITNDGNIRFMPCMGVSMGNIIDGFKLEKWDCATMGECPYMLGAWNLILKIKTEG